MEEIPSIDLYLDQVVLLYVNQICPPASPDKEKGLTASMVNNYVKHDSISKTLKENTNANKSHDWLLLPLSSLFFLSKKLLKPLIPYTQTLIRKELNNALWTIWMKILIQLILAIQASCQTYQTLSSHWKLSTQKLKEEEQWNT